MNYDEVKKYLHDNQKVWLITGVAGFIGSNLLEKLLILNQKVIGLDSFITGYKKNISQAIEDAERIASKSLSHNFTFVEGDISEEDVCNNLCKGVDYVLHQAALGSVPRSINDPIKSNKANVNGFLNILRSAQKAEVQRFVYASSSSVYGDNQNLPKSEELIGSPLSTYALTKLINELYGKLFKYNYNFDSIGLRYFNVFGKRQDPGGAYAAVIPKWINKIIRNEEVFINGDGKTSRDFCFVNNAVQMNILAATTKNKKALNQIYNVAFDDRTSLNNLYDIIQKKLIKKQIGVVKAPPSYREFRKGDVRHSQADLNRAILFLGYLPKYDLSKGLDNCLDWYINNNTKLH